MTLTPCPTCGFSMTPARLAAHVVWGKCVDIGARRDRSRHRHPSTRWPTPDTDGVA